MIQKEFYGIPYNNALIPKKTTINELYQNNLNFISFESFINVSTIPNHDFCLAFARLIIFLRLILRLKAIDIKKWKRYIKPRKS
jgi:hypothetical protein